MSPYPINVLYGTVTGNAEEIARRIHNELPGKKLGQGLLCSLEDYANVPSFNQGGSDGYAVVVVSTTGDGDPPETIRPFMRLLRKKKDTEVLKQLRFTVLALGDTNYENFCNTGKRVDKGLAKLGATRFYKRGDADDGVGLELVVEPWLEGLWTALSNEVERNAKEGPVERKNVVEVEQMALAPQEKDEAELETVVKAVTVQELGFDEARLPKVFPPKLNASVLDAGPTFEPPTSVNLSYNPDVVRCASISAAQLLTSPDAGKIVWHVEVTCDESNSIKKKYRPGDAFGVIVENDPDEVQRFLKIISVDGDSILKVVKDSGDSIATAPVSQFAAQRIDLRAVPKKSLLRCMSDYCEDIDERKALLHLCSRDGRKQYSEELVSKNMSIVEILEQKAPSCRAPISLFLDQLPCVAPRWYSATSSPELDGSAVLQFAFSVVEKGLATNSLSKACEQFLKGQPTRPVLLIARDSDSTSHFRPPVSMETDYIMIGPGTGVAPFRGFLRERAARVEKEQAHTPLNSKTILFFGCRYADKDFLYREDLEKLEETGILSSLDVAISRGGAKKVYVQDRLKARASEVADVVKNGGKIFVCGDGGGMAQSVHLILGGILAEHCCEGNEEEGKSMLRSLAEEHRYVRDIWYYGEHNQ
ncbi:Methionine synthase reductase MTRR [Chondrus crispus]|uniref:Methionine synthase reductase n=1 Tax=Chondrus crispus TaxID=2769 RepID=R7Q2Y9_CHOCR|nr:Methionine synthase reductase MTRR [Chondrus crispus]CDF32263.1 Methionine synthase reductase MTRR [Chondrus crispus]|eukprot:XP_005711928.1 Methionine synthase reductase MTRR [Chondrus crispus]